MEELAMQRIQPSSAAGGSVVLELSSEPPHNPGGDSPLPRRSSDIFIDWNAQELAESTKAVIRQLDLQIQ